ncbi:MAG: alkaline phosphatase D family protein [Acidimicrobiales bacterium]
MAEFPTRVVAGRGGMSRRDLLKVLGIGVPGAYLMVGCTPSPEQTFPAPNHADPDPVPFVDGVIAGDPLPDGAVIWTRLQPAVAGPDVGVLWSVSADPSFATVVAGGVTSAAASSDYSVHVLVDGLPSDSWFYYRFEAEGVASRVGRLRTAPAPGASVDSLRFAFSSCQQLNPSWFVAHRAAATEPDLDFFMHLGDYVYVSDGGTISLGDYRSVYHRWRRDPLLRDFHAAVPMVAMWDDGEFYNGVDRLGPPARLAAAKQAWFENMPIINPGADLMYRNVGWGSLVDFPMIDARSYRDPYLDTGDFTQGPGLTVYDADRSQLGATQYQWLVDQLTGSSADWRIVGNGVPISPWRLVNEEFLRPFRPDLPKNAGYYIQSDGWDDYMVERRNLLQAILDAGVTDTVFATGQTHISIVSELRTDPDAGGPVAAFEFVSQSMTADPDVRRAYLKDVPTEIATAALRLGEQFMLGQNPGMRYLNLENQGYVLVDLNPEEMVVQYRHIDTYNPDATAYTGAKFRLTKGGDHIEQLPSERETGSSAL